MGDPVPIVNLARDLIVLSGLEPEKDIEIKFTGPRPGEKIFEGLLNPETRVLPTPHEKIIVVETDPVDFANLETEIKTLLKLKKVPDTFWDVTACLLISAPLVIGQGRARRAPAPW
jgi:FlaA1/EpsC-like NDP-sugar epimerase